MATYMDGMEGGKHNSDDSIASFTPKKKERHFVIKWEIDEFSTNPLDALRKAIAALPDENSLELDDEEGTLATVFDITEMKDGKEVKKFQIDVLEVNPFNSDDRATFDEDEHLKN